VHARRQPTGETSAQAASSQRDLGRLIDAYLTTQLLYVAAKLGVADVLAGGPRTSREIAHAVGADSGALARVLRGLVLEDVLVEEDGGRFALTALGEGLRDGVPRSLRGAALARGELYWSAAAGLLRAVTEGGSAFEHIHHQPFFEYLARDPDGEGAFQASMADRARGGGFRVGVPTGGSHHAADAAVPYDRRGRCSRSRPRALTRCAP
jgi:Dimerisation domain